MEGREGRDEENGQARSSSSTCKKVTTMMDDKQSKAGQGRLIPAGAVRC